MGSLQLYLRLSLHFLLTQSLKVSQQWKHKTSQVFHGHAQSPAPVHDPLGLKNILDLFVVSHEHSVLQFSI